MSEPIIKVDNLGKMYQIQHQEGARYYTLRDIMAGSLKSVARLFRARKPSDPRTTQEKFWALKDVNFEVKEGEVVGIIGRNGAGKSTLLKILSRITEPTAGRVTLNGRVASLLEVGTGFHPELTGRENIYLNGSILGMKRREIDRKFDEIVAFSGVEKFLDTPVKRYSSGMYVRLAFAVAAHLEPEILVVDEVLAVGDAEFQKKCLGKMGEVAQSGRTVLFVSHNMAAVQRLCTRGIVLVAGQVAMRGTTEEAVSEYLRLIRTLQKTALADRVDRKGDGKLRFVSVTLHDEKGSQTMTPLSGEVVRVRLHYVSDFHGEEHNVDVAFKLFNSSGMAITTFANTQTAQERMPVYPQGYFECLWPKTTFRGGDYNCTLYGGIDGEVCDWVQNAFNISLEDGDFFGTGRLITRDHGDVICEQTWASQPL